MRVRDLVDALAKRREGTWVLGGLAAMLAGVEWLMMPKARCTALPGRRADPKLAVKPERSSFFSVKRTKSELGYTYWVLQGHGEFASFELFDSWGEAIIAAEARIAEIRAAAEHGMATVV